MRDVVVLLKPTLGQVESSCLNEDISSGVFTTFVVMDGFYAIVIQMIINSKHKVKLRLQE